MFSLFDSKIKILELAFLCHFILQTIQTRHWLIFVEKSKETTTFSNNRLLFFYPTSLGIMLATGYLCDWPILLKHSSQFNSVQSLSRVRLFATPWIAARQASLSNTNSQSSLKLTSIESVMPSSHLILCRPLLLLPPVSPSIRVFSSVSTLRMR